MGQQQLLLIVLGVIIVGIAIVVGINLFNANAEESTKDTMASEGTNLGALAQQHYKKPVALGGGGNAFDISKGGQAWTIPPKLLSTTSGSWTAVVGASVVTLTGTPNDYTWTAQVYITPDSIGTRIVAPAP